MAEFNSRLQQEPGYDFARDLLQSYDGSVHVPKEQQRIFMERVEGQLLAATSVEVKFIDQTQQSK